MTIERVVVLHGYTADPSKHWFGWLTDMLASDGLSVVIPALPDTENPDLAAWVAAARTALGTDLTATVVVGHSLGAVTALHAVTGLGPIAGLIAVAGFVDPVPGLPNLDPFTRPAPAVAAVSDQAARRVVIHSDDDTVVPPELSRELARQLRAPTIEIPAGGHLMGSDGFDSLPELANLIRSWGEA